MYPDDLNTESFATGMVVGANKGYQRGLAEGQAQGEAAGYGKGYDAGKADGEAAGYDRGYETGKATGEAEGYSKGHDDGYAQGQTDGEATGYNKGYEAGYAQGKIDGDAAGYERGYNEGLALADEEYQKGYQDGYKAGQAASGGGDGDTLKPAEDGATELYIDIVADALRSQSLCFKQTVERGVVVDWGDGTVETLAGTGAVSISHIYEAIGEYVIRLLPSTGCELTLGNDLTPTNTAKTLFSDNVTTNNGRGIVLKKAIVGKQVQRIGANAFLKCHGLKEVYISDGVKALGFKCFYNCNALHKIRLPDSLESLDEGYEFYWCYGLSEINIPANITKIGNYTFYCCQSLSSMTFTGITSIGKEALAYCRNLQMASLPDSITSIEPNTFSNTYNLRELHIKAATPPTLSGTLSVGYSNYNVYIPKGSMEEYAAADYWSRLVARFIEE